MRKIYIRTSDVFVGTDDEKQMEWFNFCRKKALELGIACKWNAESSNRTLFMEGSKRNFIKYYFASLLKTERPVRGIKRLISIVFT